MHLRIGQGIDRVQVAQRGFRVDRLAGGGALVRFQRIAKAAVRVLVSLQRRDHRRFGPLAKQGGEQVAVDQASVAPDKILSKFKRLDCMVSSNSFKFLILYQDTSQMVTTVCHRF